MSICSQLGYPADELEPTLVGPRLDRALEIQVRLEAVDLALFQGTIDGMAQQVEKLGLNYSTQRVLLLQEAQSLLMALSVLAGLPILYNRYTQHWTEDEALPLAIRQYVARTRNLAHPCFTRNEGVSPLSGWSFESWA